MNRLFFLLLAISSYAVSYSQKDYRVVFDLTSKDSLDQRALVRWVTEVIHTEPTAKVEVVMYGQGVFLATKNKSYVTEEISKLAADPNVNFSVCAVAMKNQHVNKEDLITGINIVPDGIYEIISKQRQGWGYIKAVH